MWICHTATPRARSRCRQPAKMLQRRHAQAAKRASGSGVAGVMAVGANRSSHRSDARPRGGAAGALSGPAEVAGRGPVAVHRGIRWIAAQGGIGGREQVRSRAVPQKRNCAPAPRREKRRYWRDGRRRKRGLRSPWAVRQRGRAGGAGGPTYSLALLIVIAPAGVDSGAAQARRGLTPARSP